MAMTRTADGLKFRIDTSEETFGAATSIAHLAVNSFAGIASEALHTDDAVEIVERDWTFELADYDSEYGVSMTAQFKDGSKLTVCAWRMQEMAEACAA